MSSTKSKTNSGSFASRRDSDHRPPKVALDTGAYVSKRDNVLKKDWISRNDNPINLEIVTKSSMNMMKKDLYNFWRVKKKKNPDISLSDATGLFITENKIPHHPCTLNVKDFNPVAQKKLRKIEAMSEKVLTQDYLEDTEI